nr:solute carrier family 35 member F1-like [Ipomoea batatas]
MGNHLKELWSKKTLLSLGLGQFLSLLITSTGFSSSELARRGINVPTSQSFFNYVLLALFYGAIMIYRKEPLKSERRCCLTVGLFELLSPKLESPVVKQTGLAANLLEA